MVVVWSKRAKTALLKAYEYIYQDSPKIAAKVRDAIIDNYINLANNPEAYPPDKYKKDNDGTWRAFEKYRYIVAYRVLKNQVRIVRMRHTSRSPLPY